MEFTSGHPDGESDPSGAVQHEHQVNVDENAQTRNQRHQRHLKRDWSVNLGDRSILRRFCWARKKRPSQKRKLESAENDWMVMRNAIALFLRRPTLKKSLVPDEGCSPMTRRFSTQSAAKIEINAIAQPSTAANSASANFRTEPAAAAKSTAAQDHFAWLLTNQTRPGN